MRVLQTLFKLDDIDNLSDETGGGWHPQDIIDELHSRTNRGRIPSVQLNIVLTEARVSIFTKEQGSIVIDLDDEGKIRVTTDENGSL